MWETLKDPFLLARVLWPDVDFYAKQRELIRSVEQNDETVCVAGNMLGKDFCAAFMVLWFFLTRTPCRVVTTSVDGAQLTSVLWGEMRRFIQSSRYPLDAEDGGPLIITHQRIRKVGCPLSYIMGRVAAKGEGLQGHHIAKTGDGVPRTFAVGDEASGLDDEDYKMLRTWSDRRLFIGNPWPCNNFFFKAVEGDGENDSGGDVPRAFGGGWYRKVVEISAEDSPNVQLGAAQAARGLVPTDEYLVPGVKGYAEYCMNLAMWDEVQQCISLQAKFWKGKQILMYPPQWLNRCNELADKLMGSVRRPTGFGVDTAEGGDSTVYTAADELGLIAQESTKTPDTAVIPRRYVEFCHEHGGDPNDGVFDRGGGGYEHVCTLRAMGYDGVRSLGFGESAHHELHRGITLFDERVERQEERFAYFNMRAKLYGELRVAMDPSGPGYAIPRQFTALRRQLAVFPMVRDAEGRLKLPPKRKLSGASGKSLTDIIGHSPDEADSAVLACYAVNHRRLVRVAGAY